jgi:hypothetical protein
VATSPSTHAPLRKTVALIVGVVMILAGAGVALAYWTNTGSGRGTATTGTNSPITVNQTSSVTAMAPGVAAQPLSGDFTNTNSGPVFVAAVTATVTGTDVVGCDDTDYTIAGRAAVNAEVPVGTNVGTWTGLTIAFNNQTGINQDACKGATVSIVYAAS